MSHRSGATNGTDGADASHFISSYDVKESCHMSRDTMNASRDTMNASRDTMNASRHAGVAQLTALTALTCLNLFSTGVSDVGVAHLTSLLHLRCTYFHAGHDSFLCGT